MFTSKTISGAWHLPALAAGLTLSTALAALAAPAAPAKADLPLTRTLAAQPTTGWASVILKTAGTLTPAQEARIVALGGDVTRRLPIISALAVRVPARNLARLTALPFVAHLSLDGAVAKDDAFTVASSGDMTNFQQSCYTGSGVTVAVLDSGVTPLPDLSSQYGDLWGQAPSRLLASVNLSNALPANAYGGVTFTINLNGGVSLVNNGNAFDPCGHGTHVAGIIGGNGTRSSTILNTQTFYGIAPQASLVSVRVLDQNGMTTVSTVIAGLQWAVTNQKKYKIRVVNLSLGHPVSESYTTDPLCQAVEAAWKAGIVVVCAAGNGGRTNGSVNTPGLSNEGWGTAYGSIQSPANDPSVITVGATKQNVLNGVTDPNRADDKIATYSSRGPSRLDLVLKPDILAPGNKVISLDADGSTLDTVAGATNAVPYSAYTRIGGSTASGDYFQLSGTSMAAPVVAGAVALMLQANPSLTPDTVKARLMLSADKWADPTGNPDPLTYGAGYLDIPAALASTVTATLPALSPTLTQNADSSISVVMNPAAWGTTAPAPTTGSRAAWGTGLWGTGVTDMRAAWGTSLTFPAGVTADRAAWGTNTLTSSRAAWGTAAVWSDRAAWGTSTSNVDLTSTALQGE